MKDTIDINELIDEAYVLGKVKEYLQQDMEGDMIEQVIYMLWDDESGYGNPHDLTEQEHDDLIRPYVVQYLSQPITSMSN